MRTMPLQNPQLDGTTFSFSAGPTGLLLLHGLLATTAEVRPLGERLHAAGFSVSAPLLPGHGTTVEDLCRRTWLDWAETAGEALESLTRRCERVVVAGESMGGMLALLLAAMTPSLSGLILYAPALRLRSRLALLTPLVRHVLTSVAKNREGEDPASIVNQRWQGYTMDCPAAVAELLALQRQVRRRLHLVKAPVLILQGRKDLTLRPEGAQELFQALPNDDKELFWFERSTHCLLLDEEWERAVELSAAFAARVGKP